MAEKSMEEEIDGTRSWQDDCAQETEEPKEPAKGDEAKPEEGKPEGAQEPEGGEVPKGDGEGEPEKRGEQEPKKPEDPKGDRKDYFNDGHTPQGIQKRFSEFTRKVRGLEDEVAALKAENEKLKSQKPAKSRADYANDEDWMKGVVDERVGSAVAQALSEERERVAMENSRRTFEKNEDEARSNVTDYDEVMSSDVGRLDVDKETMKYVLDSSVGPMIQYTLKKIPAVRDSFLAAPVANRLAVVRGIERRLLEIRESSKKQAQQPPKQEQPQTQPPKEETPKAPAIRAPQQAKVVPSNKLDPATCSMDEWMENGD